MKAFALFLSLFLGLVCFGPTVWSAPNPKVATAPVNKNTDMSFEDMLVQGKYHFSDESVTTVEQDKVLDSLLGVRKDFKDRIKKSANQQ